MADIDIQEKRGGAIWPWIVGALALVLVIWGATEMMGGDDEGFVAITAEEQQPLETTPATDAAVPTEVTQFEQQCGTQQNGAQAGMGVEHEFVEQCIRSMTAALNNVVQREQVNNTQLTEKYEQYRQKADNLTQDPQSTEHAAMVDEVFDDAASLLRDLEEARAGATPALERRADQVQQAADQVSSDQLLLEQREAVGSFFREMSAALRTLATA